MSTTTTSNVTYTGSNVLIDSLFWGGAWDTPGSGTTVIEYSLRFGSDPYSYFSGISYGNAWSNVEETAIETVFAAWEAVADIDFQQTYFYDDADVWYWQGSDFELDYALGWHEVPDTSAQEPLYGVFSYEGLGWDSQGLLPGGYAYLTLLHEIGHGLGLAHPHDNGGDSSIMPGVSSAFDDFGDNDLNQGVWTVMTYNDGWLTEYPSHTPYSQTNYGYSATPMALDIATIQEIYGANTTYANGDDTYVLPDSNGSGTYWSCIWDTGGEDVISVSGLSRDFTIDLREAPLTGANAAGYMSYSVGIVGGMTIANGVEIENAIGGSGDDTINGNDLDNSLIGDDGDDSLTGFAGDDTMDGGAGADHFDGGDGYDIVSYESATRSVRVDLQNAAFMYNDAVGDTFANVEAFQTGGTVDQLRGDAAANFFYTGGLSDRLYGRAGDDFLFGEAGADALYGGTGADTMTGGDDADRRDRYIYFNIVESGVGDGNRDVITDFVSGEDRIEIRRFDADATSGGKQYFDFVGDAGLSGTAGELAYVQTGGNTIIQADVDGDGVADFEIELTGIMDLTAGDFLI